MHAALKVTSADDTTNEATSVQQLLSAIDQLDEKASAFFDKVYVPVPVPVLCTWVCVGWGASIQSCFAPACLTASPVESVDSVWLSIPACSSDCSFDFHAAP